MAQSLPVRLLACRFMRLRAMYLEVLATTDLADADHGRQVELLGEEVDALEQVIQRLLRLKKAPV